MSLYCHLKPEVCKVNCFHDNCISLSFCRFLYACLVVQKYSVLLAIISYSVSRHVCIALCSVMCADKSAKQNTPRNICLCSPVSQWSNVVPFMITKQPTENRCNLTNWNQQNVISPNQILQSCDLCKNSPRTVQKYLDKIICCWTMIDITHHLTDTLSLN